MIGFTLPICRSPAIWNARHKATCARGRAFYGPRSWWGLVPGRCTGLSGKWTPERKAGNSAGSGRILRFMDTPKIQLFPERGKTGVWKWEILLEDKMVSNGLYSGSSEHAYTAAHEALLKYQRNEMTRQNSWVKVLTSNLVSRQRPRLNGVVAPLRMSANS